MKKKKKEKKKSKNQRKKALHRIFLQNKYGCWYWYWWNER